MEKQIKKYLKQYHINPQEFEAFLQTVDIHELIPLAKVGLDALIDEVTGFQEVRMKIPGNPLAKLFKKYSKSKQEITQK